MPTRLLTRKIFITVCIIGMSFVLRDSVNPQKTYAATVTGMTVSCQCGTYYRNTYSVSGNPNESLNVTQSVDYTFGNCGDQTVNVNNTIVLDASGNGTHRFYSNHYFPGTCSWDTTSASLSGNLTYTGSQISWAAGACADCLNSPPTCTSINGVVDPSENNTGYNLDATASDPDAGDVLYYEWTSSAGSFNDASSSTPIWTTLGNESLGVQVDLTVADRPVGDAARKTAVCPSVSTDVLERITSCLVSPNPFSILESGTQALSSSYTASDAAIDTYSWASDDTDVGTVSPSNQSTTTFTGVLAGSASVDLEVTDIFGNAVSCASTANVSASCSGVPTVQSRSPLEGVCTTASNIDLVATSDYDAACGNYYHDYDVDGSATNNVAASGGTATSTLNKTFTYATHTWNIRGQNDSGEGSWNGNYNLYVKQDPSGLNETNILDTSARLNWSNGQGTGYDVDVRYRVAGGVWSSWIENTTASTYHDLTGLSASTNYEWALRSQTTGCTDEIWYDTFTTVAPICGGVPSVTSFSPSAGSCTQDITPTLSATTWPMDSACGGYYHNYQVDGGAISSDRAVDAGGTSSYIHTTSLSYSTHNWRARGVNNDGDGSWTSNKVLYVNAYPSGLNTAGVSDTTATLQWSAGGGTGYNVDVRYRISGGVWSSWIDKNTATSHGLTGLLADTTYEWQINATYSGTSCSSQIIDGSSFTTSPEPCVAPSPPTTTPDDLTCVTGTTATFTATSTPHANCTSHSHEFEIDGGSSADVVAVAGTSTYTPASLSTTSHSWRARAETNGTFQSSWTSPNKTLYIKTDASGLYETNVDHDSATLNWTNGVGEGYDVYVRYKKVADPTWPAWNMTPSGSDYHYATLLDPETDYTWAIQTLYTGTTCTTEIWYGSFTTDIQICIAPGEPSLSADICTTDNTPTLTARSPIEGGCVLTSYQHNFDFNSVQSGFLDTYTSGTNRVTDYSIGWTSTGAYAWTAQVRNNTETSAFTSPSKSLYIYEEPTGLTVDTVGSTEAFVSWFAGSGAGYSTDVRYRIAGGLWSSWNSVAVGVSEYTFSNLTPGEDFEWQLRANYTGCSSVILDSATFGAGFTTKGRITVYTKQTPDSSCTIDLGDLSGVDVYLYQGIVLIDVITSDASGVSEFLDLDMGTYIVSVTRDDYLNCQNDIEITLSIGDGDKSPVDDYLLFQLVPSGWITVETGNLVINSSYEPNMDVSTYAVEESGSVFANGNIDFGNGELGPLPANSDDNAYEYEFYEHASFDIDLLIDLFDASDENIDYVDIEDEYVIDNDNLPTKKILIVNGDALISDVVTQIDVTLIVNGDLTIDSNGFSDDPLEINGALWVDGSIMSYRRAEPVIVRTDYEYMRSDIFDGYPSSKIYWLTFD